MLSLIMEKSQRVWIDVFYIREQAALFFSRHLAVSFVLMTAGASMAILLGLFLATTLIVCPILWVASLFGLS